MLSKDAAPDEAIHDRPRPAVRWTGVCIDCRDAEEMAHFYRHLLGWDVTARDGDDWVQLGDPTCGVHLNIQAESSYEAPTWPETPGAQAKMLHLELLVEDLELAVTHAIASGATEAIHQPSDRDQARLRVMLDPAGHPFCLSVAGD